MCVLIAGSGWDGQCWQRLQVPEISLERQVSWDAGQGAQGGHAKADDSAAAGKYRGVGTFQMTRLFSLTDN